MIFVDQLVMSADWVPPHPGSFVGPLLEHDWRLDPEPDDFVGPEWPFVRDHQHGGGFPVMFGVRRISYREPGDIGSEGQATEEHEIVGESQSPAWLHGSHETRLQVKSDGKKLLFAGNPGRFGRPDNVFNLDWDQSVKRVNEVLAEHGFPKKVMFGGRRVNYDELNKDSSICITRADESSEARYWGARVWGAHFTQNYTTGGPDNLRAVLAWLGTQTMRRVTSKQRGSSTIEFGAIGYCQTQLYDKAAEILAHCKSKQEKLFLQSQLTQEEEKEFLYGRPDKHHPDWMVGAKTEAEISALHAKRKAWEYAYENGLLRVEVKCAKDYLVHKGLTYLGAWDMGTVIEIFNERTEIIRRLEVEVDDFDVNRLPKTLKMAAAAWLAGVDLRSIMPYSTFARKAKELGKYGLDVYKVRDLAVVRPIMAKKRIEVEVATPPAWYELNAA